MRRLLLGLVVFFAACGDSPTLQVDTPRHSQVYRQSELRSDPDERYVMQVGQLGTASCYLDIDQDESCGPATYEPCNGFEILDPSANLEVIDVIQAIGEPSRVDFIARAPGSGQLLFHADGMDKPLLVEVTERTSP